MSEERIASIAPKGKGTTLFDFGFLEADVQKYLASQKRRLLTNMKKRETVSVPDIPQFKIPNNATLFIASNDVAYASHGIHEFPAKYIPQVPRWALRKYVHRSSTSWVLDPFCGSGTTLVEAKLHGVNSYGIDIDPMARLLTKVKTTPVETDRLLHARRCLLDRIESRRLDRPMLPEIPNRRHWFTDDVSYGIEIVRSSITELENEDLRNFFLVCLSSIIRDVSLADPDQVFPEKTKWGLKKKAGRSREYVLARFKTATDKFIPRILEFSKSAHRQAQAIVLESDARKIELPDKSIHLAITSPPYINAMDYPRVNQLEMYWLGLLADARAKVELKRRYVGTEAYSASDYSQLHMFGGRRLVKLDGAIRKIFKQDKLRAYVVYKFFDDMRRDFSEVFRVLKSSKTSATQGRYVVVVGDGAVRRVPIPTHEFLIKIAQDVGFVMEGVFSYLIRHRTLLITRRASSGMIDKDWVMTFRKP